MIWITFHLVRLRSSFSSEDIFQCASAEAFSGKRKWMLILRCFNQLSTDSLLKSEGLGVKRSAENWFRTLFVLWRARNTEISDGWCQNNRMLAAAWPELLSSLKSRAKEHMVSSYSFFQQIPCFLEVLAVFISCFSLGKKRLYPSLNLASYEIRY